MTKRHWIVYVATLLMIAGTALFLNRVRANEQLGSPGVRLASVPMPGPDGTEVGKESVLLPEEVGGFRSELVPVAKDEIFWLPKDTTFGKRRYWSADGFSASLSVVLMGTDRGSIHKPQFCLVGQGWRIERSETEVIKMKRPHPYDLEVMKLTCSKPVQLSDGRKIVARAVYVYWFVADGQLTPHHGQRMWWMARDLVWKGVLQRWAYVSAFWAGLPEHESVAYGRMKDLIVEAVPEFQLASGAGVAGFAGSGAEVRERGSD